MKTACRGCILFCLVGIIPTLSSVFYVWNLKLRLRSIVFPFRLLNMDRWPRCGVKELQMLQSDAAPERAPSNVCKIHSSQSATAASQLPTLLHLPQKLQGFVVKLNSHKTVLTETESESSSSADFRSGPCPNRPSQVIHTVSHLQLTEPFMCPHRDPSFTAHPCVWRWFQQSACCPL